MGSRFEETVYRMLSREPVTPNEIAKKLEISHKTALRALMHLALTKEDVYYKNSGRIHLFWRELKQVPYEEG
jgi:predicted ArsR family transcriptional regulator